MCLPYRIALLILALALSPIPLPLSAQTSATPPAAIGEPASNTEAVSSASSEPASTPAATTRVYLPFVIVPGTTGSSDTSTLSSLAQQVVDLTNQYRAAAGCAPLTVSQQLTAAAAAHSQDMATTNFFSHTGSDGSSPWDRIRRTGYTYSSAAENIAAGYRTAEQVVQAWYNSAGHRQNMLNCNLREIGVAYADGGSYGRYWTQVFATPR
ncbi:CAP domain-containing protein [Roseiflexus castenholzii]|uniref:SCP-like extracellular n=1 Tax=Roseiflexus castenholzii (strain DSM 13941 / HLO8) TaxID=383372 RepID=A7NF13_ROSCS|nr:CAP domain-containing protein [Roseiflexus castenholzii]ABU56301.1 SCP-like extracellular [Roseiflexus castenholzii DSM 13941]